jgi:phosphatidylinositol alpha-1,6-mannosyltransferase
MNNSIRVAMLLSDGFGGFGGIAKFNRDFLQALDDSVRVEHVYVLPRTIPEPIDDVIPESVVYDRRAAVGKFAYMRRILAYLLWGDPVDIVVCGHRNLLPAAWLLARFRGAYLVLVIHGIESWEPSSSALTNWLTSRIDALISVSRLTAERFTRWAKFPIDRVFILPNCVDLARFRPQPKDSTLIERYALQSSKVIMTVGRLASLERYKGFDEVIELMPRLLARYSSLKYLIVGDGPDRGRLEAKAASLKLSDKVIFAGRIPEAEKVAYYNLADGFVMPSSGEGFGIVLIEAAACGIPVVGSSKDGSREALLDGALGRLVDPANVDELFNAISSVLQEGCSGERIKRLDMFSGESFSNRVADWCELSSDAVNGVPLGSFGPVV